MLKKYARMCIKAPSCSECELTQVMKSYHFQGDCMDFILEKYEIATETINLWDKKNPIKTRQNVFLKQYPNAKIKDKILNIYPCSINSTLEHNDICKKLKNKYGDDSCDQCRKMYWSEELK